MGVVVDLSFDTLDEMPGKLRTGACVAPVLTIRLIPRMALELAARLDRATVLQAECRELRRLSEDVLESRAAFVEAQDAVQVSLLRLAGQMVFAMVTAFGCGVWLGIGLHYAGWL